ncbi:hypothetical protein O3G_MSEX008083 [Manduca sexta]|uniref:Carboxylesterase type B domain-containing protein n=1 Tax=Manduca sexta TaxID=7130 RepID=A0A921Z946_MANSE|nr:hypothetical protein O3G_MSEX008083 [Manduca sexta]
MEGLIRMHNFESWKDAMNERFSDFLPVDLQFQNEEEKEEVATTIKEFYFGDEPVNEKTILSYIDFFSDTMFTHSVLWTSSMHVKNGNNNIYLYEYSFVDEDWPVVPYTDVRGARHCAQEFSLFDGLGVYTSDEIGLSEGFRNLKEIMREMWHNFVTTG